MSSLSLQSHCSMADLRVPGWRPRPGHGRLRPAPPCAVSVPRPPPEALPPPHPLQSRGPPALRWACGALASAPQRLLGASRCPVRGGSWRRVGVLGAPARGACTPGQRGPPPGLGGGGSSAARPRVTGTRGMEVCTISLAKNQPWTCPQVPPGHCNLCPQLGTKTGRGPGHPPPPANEHASEGEAGAVPLLSPRSGAGFPHRDAEGRAGK